jgi:tripartite-type tricarboxylate transporter receptor subunit TctC
MRPWFSTAVLSLLAALAGLSAAPRAGAQAAPDAWPSRQITLVVPFPPGGATDLMARTIGQRFTKKWGQGVVIDNKPGAGGMLAGAQVAKAPADGYTLFFGATAQLSVNESIYKTMPYDVARDFAPIGLVGSVPNILVAHPAQPYKTLAELIAYAKANPGKLSYASPGSGSTAHLSAELFKSQAGVDILHVPYKGAAGGVTDVLGGQVPLMIVSMPSVVEHVKAGKLVALGVTSARRSPTLPEVPVFADTLPGFEATGWYGLLAPAKTPPHIVAMLNTEIELALKDPEVRKLFEDQGIQLLGGSAAQFSSLIASETKKWAAVIQKAGIKAD